MGNLLKIVNETTLVAKSDSIGTIENYGSGFIMAYTNINKKIYLAQFSSSLSLILETNITLNSESSCSYPSISRLHNQSFIVCYSRSITISSGRLIKHY